MTQKTKDAIDSLILKLKESQQLTAANFFANVRAEAWGGKKVTSAVLVESYNEALGRLFGRGQITWQEVKAARQVAP